MDEVRRLVGVEGPRVQRGIGIIAPFDLALDRELWRWVPAEVSLHLTRLPYVQLPVGVRMAQVVSDHRLLVSATRDLLHVEPEIVAFLCASGSFVCGIEYEYSLREAIQGAGAPEAITTSGALAEVLYRLQVSKISLVTPYVGDLSNRLHRFLAELGVAVVADDHLGLDDGIWRVPYRAIAELIKKADRPEAEAIVVSCTNLPTFDLVDPLESALGKPVLTANQTTMWACLRRMRIPSPVPGKWLRELDRHTGGASGCLRIT